MVTGIDMGTDKTDPFVAAAIPVFRPYDNIVMIIINISLVFLFWSCCSNETAGAFLLSSLSTTNRINPYTMPMHSFAQTIQYFLIADS
ncbi:hypothetical protein [Ileibacterium valens]|uniref:hypothetical protein n=1 Tax=Ileibacterium valens TaxID=1862668 RepID=UPI00272B3687|nr:hypothetical protein [Ileibacterium valens]